MAEETRFYIIFNLTEGVVADREETEHDADARAQELAKARIGNIFVVFEPKNAFRSVPKTERVYLAWPTFAHDVKEMVEPPKTPPVAMDADANSNDIPI